MKAAIAGGSGFIGKHLTEMYLEQGCEVVLISRSKRSGSRAGVQQVTWAELKDSVEPLAGTDVLVNLAGESINQRWSAEAKHRILQSRIDSVEQIGGILARLPRKPVLINASGMSIYGTSLTDSYTEESPHRITDFLAEVVEQWEAAIGRIPDVRRIMLRVGLVLGTDGGAYPQMKLPFRLGVGGPVGSGQQWHSWIHIRDICRLIAFCAEHEEMEGPVNATAPEPVRNSEFGRQVAKALHRPYYFPVPSLAMKLIFGEMSVLLLEGQRVLPQKALSHGFRFEFETLGAALQDLEGGKRR